VCVSFSLKKQKDRPFFFYLLFFLPQGTQKMMEVVVLANMLCNDWLASGGLSELAGSGVGSKNSTAKRV
jgi:hypothetical protein